MTASAGIIVTTSAATATFSAPAPTVTVSVTPAPATAMFTAPAPTIIIGPTALLAYITIPAPHPHLPADHHDAVAYGFELGLTAAVLFVGGKLVAGRIFRL